MFSFICWQRQGGVGPSDFGVWDGPEDRILGVMGYVFFSPQGEGHGVAVYDSFDLKSVAERIVCAMTPRVLVAVLFMLFV